MKYTTCFLLLALLFTACHDTEPPVEIPASAYRSGGETTATGFHSQMYQQPAANLDAQGISDHFKADANFESIFVTAPALVQGGLGPLFNQNSCGNCHIRNGRAAFPVSGADLGGLLLRLSLPGENAFGEPLAIPGFGGQLQTKAVWGKSPEAQVSISFQASVLQFLDGSTVQLQKPFFELVNPYAPFPTEALVSPRIAPPVFGLGLLEALSEADILSNADENDLDGDGISGRPNYVWDYTQQKTTLGRFGWKANEPNVLQQTAAAYNGDMGITSTMFSFENCVGQPQCDAPGNGTEVDLATLRSTTFYTQSLAVPAFRDLDDPQVQRGQKLFADMKCASCHIPSFVTGQHPEYEFLSAQKIWPYTDLLLHDMGEGLADNRPDNRATGREWRTPPLWGIGLTQTVSGHSNFLHDGRARNLTEAILWHGGEAEASKMQFQQSSVADRAAVLRFLNAL